MLKTPCYCLFMRWNIMPALCRLIQQISNHIWRCSIFKDAFVSDESCKRKSDAPWWRELVCGASTVLTWLKHSCARAWYFNVFSHFFATSTWECPKEIRKHSWALNVQEPLSQFTLEFQSTCFLIDTKCCTCNHFVKKYKESELSWFFVRKT